MIVYGYAKNYKYASSGDFYVQVRLPNIHGPYSQKEYNGKKVKNYTLDKDLPWYPSVILPHYPNDGEVVVLLSTSDASTEWLVIGLTGAQYSPSEIH